jgi:hypothetical protein
MTSLNGIDSFTKEQAHLRRGVDKETNACQFISDVEKPTRFGIVHRRHCDVPNRLGCKSARLNTLSRFAFVLLVVPANGSILSLTSTVVMEVGTVL